eukprot:TRINITY_DN7126_c0_g1_i1.p1 TRINITY_DN7126_c0_g1~~TRINITY_DN7126_c0_g1_i1.p1  ORF type:complete len:265 (+),score=83.46 TRINITY_DN7126_c0_g1_i1:65-859(+)
MKVRFKMSEARRKKQAQLARERQGTNGRWESNKKKAAARAAKRRCGKLQLMFAGSEAQRKAKLMASYKAAVTLLKKLDAVANGSAFAVLLKELRKLTVNARLLQKTLLPKKLTQAADRLGEQADEVRPVVKALLARWRQVFREDMAKKQAEASQPSRAVAKAAATGGAAGSAAAGPAALADATREPARNRRERSRSASSSSSSSSGSSSSSSSESVVATAAAPPVLPVQERGPVQQPASLAGKPKKPAKQARITMFLKAGCSGA